MDNGVYLVYITYNLDDGHDFTPLGYVHSAYEALEILKEEASADNDTLEDFHMDAESQVIYNEDYDRIYGYAHIKEIHK